MSRKNYKRWWFPNVRPQHLVEMHPTFLDLCTAERNEIDASSPCISGYRFGNLKATPLVIMRIAQMRFLKEAIDTPPLCT